MPPSFVMVDQGVHMPFRKHRALLGLPVGFWIVLGGCGDTPPGPSVVVRHSAGVRIVASQRPRLAGAASWRLSETPLLVIGTTEEGDPAHILFNIRGAVRLSDDRIVVANQGTNEIRYFDRAGRHLFTSGRTGSGPGGFQFLDAIWFGRADTVVASDRANNRLSLFDGSGAFVESFNLEAGPGVTRPFKEGVLSDGTVIASVVRRSGQRGREGVTRDSVAYLRYTARGEFGGVVATVPFLEFFTTVVDGQPVLDVVPFSQPAVVAVGQERVFLAPAKSFKVRGYSPQGALELLIRRSHDPVPVDRRHREAHRATTALLDIRDPIERRQMERFLAEVPYGEQQPAIASARTDGDGYLWIEAFRFPQPDSFTWSVFSPDGSWDTDVELPAGFRPHHIGRDFLLGVAKDQLGREQVVLFGLARDTDGSSAGQGPAG